MSRHSKLYNESQFMDKKVMTDKLKKDIAIDTAISILRHWNNENIKSVLQNVSLKIKKNELTKIKDALALHGIDWSLNPFLKLPSGENLILSWSADRISENLFQMNVKIKNEGTIDAQRLIIMTKSSNQLLDELEFPIGKLSPDKIEKRSVNINISAEMMGETEPLELIIFDQNYNQIKSIKDQLKFPEKTATYFRLNMKIIDNGKFGSEGNGDGKVQSGETIALSFEITNLSNKIVPKLMIHIKGTEGSFRINRGKVLLTKLHPKIEHKDFFLFKMKSDSKRLGKITMEIDAKNSGAAKISKLWEVEEKLPEVQVLTPILVDLKWHDLEGKTVEGETHLETLILSGKIRKPSIVQDLYVHQNDKKIFYKVNLNQKNGVRDQIDNYQVFQFKTVVNLLQGINNLSVFSRGQHGFTSEKKLRMLRR